MSKFKIGDDVIDSRDIIERIEELNDELADAITAKRNEPEEDPDDATADEVDQLSADTLREVLGEDYEDDICELSSLREIRGECDTVPDWEYGETLINADYFAAYIEELINDCYEMPAEMKSGNWPWRHVTIDYEAAAEEALVDYHTFSVGPHTYHIRSC